MLYGKKHDEEDDELPRYEEEEEEGLERPAEGIVEEIEEVIIEDESGEGETAEPAPAAARTSSAPSKAKKSKPKAKKKAAAKKKKGARKKKGGEKKSAAKKSRRKSAERFTDCSWSFRRGDRAGLRRARSFAGCRIRPRLWIYSSILFAASFQLRPLGPHLRCACRNRLRG